MANQQRIDLLHKFIEEEPESAFNKYALAMEYYEDEPEKSLKILSTLIVDSPNYLPSYYKTAHLYWAMEQFDKAAEIFLLGIELAKLQNDQKALGELSSSYLNLQFEME